MARALILDTEAVSALAHGPARRRANVLAALIVARRHEETVVLSSANFAELYKGRRQDAAIDALLSREAFDEVDVDRRLGRMAGTILGSAKAASELAIDAFVVAVAVDVGGGIILTHDPTDVKRLAAPFTNVRVEPLS